MTDKDSFNLEKDYLTINYDWTANIAHIIYRGTLTSAITTEAYQWMFKQVSAIGIENVRGGIFDFSQVDIFNLDNIWAVKQEVTSHASEVSFGDIPTALVVKTLYQENMVKISMRMNEQTDRLQIVHTQEEALAFIDGWHQNKQK